MAKTLLYELTCPGCAKIARAVFARVDGQATCESCGHTYRVQRENLRHFRVVTENPGNSDRTTDQATVAEPACETVSPPRQHSAAGGDRARARAWSFPWRVQGFRTGAALAALTVTAGLAAGVWRLAGPQLLNPVPTQDVAQMAGQIELNLEVEPAAALGDRPLQAQNPPTQMAKGEPD